MNVFPLPDPERDMAQVNDQIDRLASVQDQLVTSLAGTLAGRIADHEKTVNKLTKKVAGPIQKQIKTLRSNADDIATTLHNRVQQRISTLQGDHARLLGTTISRGLTVPVATNQAGSAGTIQIVPTPFTPTPTPPIKPVPVIGPTIGLPPGAIIPPPTTGGGKTGCCSPAGTPYQLPFDVPVAFSAQSPVTWLKPAASTYTLSPAPPDAPIGGWNAPVQVYLRKAPGLAPEWVNAQMVIHCSIPGDAPNMIVEAYVPRSMGGDWVSVPVTGLLSKVGNGHTYRGPVTIPMLSNSCALPSTDCIATMTATFDLSLVKVDTTGACGGGGPPPPPPPPPPDCCPPAVINVPLPCGEDVCYTDTVAAGEGPTCPPDLFTPDGGINLPLPGSLAWCLMQRQIVEFFMSVGEKLVAWADEALNSGWDNGEEYMEAKSWIDIGSNVIDKFGRVLWRTVIAYGIDVKNEIRKLLCEYNKMASQVLASAAGLVTLGIVRGLVRCLRDVQIGINWPIRLTVSIPIEIPQLLRALDYITESLFPSIVPTTANAWDAWGQGQITTELRDCWLGMNGVSAPIHLPVAIAHAPRLSPDQVREYGLRNGWDDGTIDKWINERGWIRDPDRNALGTLFFKLPDHGQLAGYTWHQDTDGGYVARYGLDDGWDAYWGEYGKRVIEPAGVTEQVAYLRYIATAAMPSPESSLQYLYRLRPGREGVTTPFTSDDYNWMLKAAGYGPVYREWAMQTRYQEMPIQDVQRLWECHVLTDDEYTNELYDRGTNPDDIKTVMQSRRIGLARVYASEGILISPTTAVGGALYQVWPISTAVTLLESQGYTGEDVLSMIAVASDAAKVRLAQRAAQRAARQLISAVIQGYMVGTVSRDAAVASLASAGWTGLSIETFLSALDIGERTKVAGRILAAIKAAYMQGRISDTQLPTYLSTAGINPDRAEQYALEWSTERIVYKPDMSLSDIKRWVKEGIVSISQAAKWLGNLGYRNPTATLLIDEMEWQLSQAMVKANKTKTKTANAAFKAIAKAKTAARSLEAAAKSQARRDLPVSTLKAAYKCGALTREDVLSKLGQMGYSNGAATIIVETWDAGSKGTCQPASSGDDSTA